MEPMMKLQHVFLTAMAKKITWWEAAGDHWSDQLGGRSWTSTAIFGLGMGEKGKLV
jgi:hypothetical protein